MIRVYGDTKTEEGAAAQDLSKLLATAWPWLKASENDHAVIVAQAKLYGQRVQDVDIIMLLNLQSPKAIFRPTTALADKAGNPVHADEVTVESLCLVIEVKSHSPQNVRFSGAKVEVRYRNAAGDEWHDASEQSQRQIYSLKNAIENRLGPDAVPFIVNLLWMRNVARHDLPKPPHKIIPRVLSWSGILNLVVANMAVIPTRHRVLLAATWQEAPPVFPEIESLLAERLVPTDLDRMRMDRIASAAVEPTWLATIGRQQLVLQGFGGTGKTVRMLALGWKVFEKGRRVLLLTYNVSLAADLRRLLTLMDMTDGAGEPCIRIQTVHSFLARWFAVVRTVEEESAAFYDNFEQYKDQMLELLRAGAFTPADAAQAIGNDAERLSWDCILIDEGQDWPANERELLHRLYAHTRFVVADGRDQLVRGGQHCDWGVDAPLTTRVKLNRGLRMKPNLATFANALASAMGLATWEIETNPDAIGGRVLILEGEYADARRQHALAVEAAAKAGNSPVDLLVCVPPQLVNREGGERSSPMAALLESWGHQLWDGISEDARRSFPTHVDQLRLLQYDSCRGLEGWVVFALRIDQFFDYKLASGEAALKTHFAAAGGAGGPVDPQASRRAAARWLMIPCTRAIDTLILHVGAEPSALKTLLRRVHAQHPDIVEWVQLIQAGND